MIKTCLTCGKQFKTFPCRVGKYCSYACSAIGTNNSPFVVGHKIRVPQEARKRQSEKMKQYSEENCWNWKNIITKRTLHHWVQKSLGKASCFTCAICGKQANDWSSKTHEYKRDLTEFQPLCRKCHINYDIKNGFRTYK